MVFYIDLRLRNPTLLKKNWKKLSVTDIFINYQIGLKDNGLFPLRIKMSFSFFHNFQKILSIIQELYTVKSDSEYRFL